MIRGGPDALPTGKVFGRQGIAPKMRQARITDPGEMLIPCQEIFVLAELEHERDIHPVDLIEHVALQNKWEFDRSSDDEISLTVAGQWTEYNVSLSWMEDFEALHLACAFDMKVPAGRIGEVMRLLSLINEQLLIGHFDLWNKEGALMFRQTLMLNGGAIPTGEQLECLLMSALEACERYYQAFQFVVWAGYTAEKSLDYSLFETSGNA